ncbi:MAG: dTDP-4-dehydrorhamnose reductase [Candidatus Ventricola sp.]
MKVLVTGVCGQLGHDVVNELAGRGHEAIGSDITPAYSGAADGTEVTRAPYVQLDITDAGAVSRVLGEARPDAVIHCAAWTAVDAAEDNEDRVRAINAGGTEHIARACRATGAKMMYLSTDYVFDGRGETPWEPDCRDYAPLSVYGRTKLEGEQAVASLLSAYFIVRIAWVFGVNGKNFIKTMLSLGQKHERLRVVCDQIGTPTYTLDLARLLVDMIETDKYGYYHATNEGGYISWADFAKEIFRQAGMPTKVVPVTTSEYGLSRAARPYNSRLDKTKLVESGFAPLPDWRDALSRYLREIGCMADKAL